VRGVSRGQIRTLQSVPADIEPPALARLVDFAECPRTEDWSLRAALVRYAQPQPQRVNDLLDLVRRTEWALGRHAAVLQREGEALWDALEGDVVPTDREQAQVVNLLRVAMEFARIGDVLAGWAVDISGDRPDAAVDATIKEVGARLEALGVPHEERPPPRQRGG
jgi:hypothetical protein